MAKSDVKSLKQQAYEILSKMYLSGELKSGDPLIELDLSDQLRISRTPLREAFLQLEKEGIVEIIPRKGAFIKRITLHDIQELFQIREAVEGMAASLAAGRITQERFLKMDSKFNEVLNTAEEVEKYRIAEDAGELVHDTVLYACDNQRIRDILASYRTVLTQERRKASSIPSRLADALVEHMDILEGLKSGPSQAERAMKIHIRNTLDSIVGIS